MIQVAIGSKNAVKLNAVKQGLELVWNKSEPPLGSEIHVEGFDAPSGVRDQPIGDEEIKLGAMNRAREAYRMFVEQRGVAPDYSFGIEGGIIVLNPGAENEEMDCMAYVVAFDGKQFGKARTASFSLPLAIRSLVNNGTELGIADGIVFNRISAKQGEGTIGHLTRGLIDRTAYYVPAVVLSMIPLQWPVLWPV